MITVIDCIIKDLVGVIAVIYSTFQDLDVITVIESTIKDYLVDVIAVIDSTFKTSLV